MVCRDLLKLGYCQAQDSPAGCRFTHFLKFCKLCNMTLVTPFSFEHHIFGREHSRRLYHTGGAIDANCTICQRDYNPSGRHFLSDFVQHCRTPSHQRQVNELGVDLYIEEREEANTALPPHLQMCITCKKPILKDLWSVHLTTRKHYAALDYHANKAAHDDLAQNRHGIEITSNEELNAQVDMGTKRVSIPISIKLTAPGDISIIDVRLASTSGSRRFTQRSPFTAPSWRGPLELNQERRLQVLFNPSNFGRFSDRVEIVFRDADIGEAFVITRELRAVVGNQQALQSLGPVAPFIRPKRRNVTRSKEDDDVDGVQYSFISDIEWVAKLPWFGVPNSIKAALEDGSVADQLATVQKTILPPTVTASNYSRNWSSLIWIEEMQMTVDLANYDMDGEGLEFMPPNQYKLEVPGLAEKRPSVILNDKIRVRLSGTTGRWYAGYVHQVHQKAVVLRFHHSFTAHKGQKFDVHFSLSRSPLRRMHQALNVAWNPERILFPAQEHIIGAAEPTANEIAKLELFNRSLDKNPPQKLAVASVLKQRAGSPPFVVFGPPGTGKTVVAVECIRQLLDRDPQARIFACAPSNSAADLLTDRLRQQGLSSSEVFRLNAPTRLADALPQPLINYSKKEGGHFLVPRINELLRFRVIVSTLVSASLPHALGAPRGHFSHIFIDEAGQAMEPEAMIPIRTMAGPKTNIVLSGDPKQLGPIVRSSVALRCGLGISYLDRLTSRDVYKLDVGHGITIVKLTQNFRNHSSILSYPNRCFYNGDLETRADPAITHSLNRFDRLASPNFPVIFHSISGEDMREATSPSFFNPHEVLVVKDYVQALRTDQKLRLDDSQIGIISPYNAQNAKIRQTVNTPALKKGRTGHLKVGSVEEFQGQERRVIIISTVRSNTKFVEFDLRHTLGFVANPRRFNVAVTRAQALLIVIGDPVVLSLDPMWRDFLNYVHKNNGWKGKPKDWNEDYNENTTSQRDFVAERRADAKNAMDELTRLLERTVIAEVDSEDEREEGDDGGKDKPWREAE